MLAKGMFIGNIVSGPGRAFSTVTIQIGLQFIPQIMLAFFTTIGFFWSSMKLILYHPETLLLPLGTNIKKCDKKVKNRDGFDFNLTFPSSVRLYSEANANLLQLEL